MTSSISAWIWSERFWLPENVSWADLEHPPAGVEYPSLGHMLYALPLAAVVLLLRRLFERLVAQFSAELFFFSYFFPLSFVRVVSPVGVQTCGHHAHVANESCCCYTKVPTLRFVFRVNQ